MGAQVPQVTIAINNRLYQVGCEAGQEQHITRLASYIDTKVKELANQAGQVGDARLLLMAALLIADELADAYDDLESARASHVPAAGEAAKAKSATGSAAHDERERAEARAAESMTQLAQRLDKVAQRLERG